MKTSIPTPEAFEKFKADCSPGLQSTGWIEACIESLRPSYYPAVISWDFKAMPNSGAVIDGDIIYLSDFEELK